MDVILRYQEQPKSKSRHIQEGKIKEIERTFNKTKTGIKT